MSLQQFQLEGVRDTGRTVGDGSYATVKELEFRGLKCVGKKLHGILFNSASPQEKAAMLERFAGECELLSRLHHPCIVQFLGVLIERGSQLPVLVMEYLHTNLSSCLDRYGVLPEEIGYGILRDVALGLRYLHESIPPIIHRDLSANNVLLTTNMNAKVSDLGVARILNLSPAQLTQMTQTPGTPCYMPPEAMVARPKYTVKVDIFSYGVLMVHVFSGRWPIPGEAFREDPNNPHGTIPVSEFDRRLEYIALDHPLVELIRCCLNNISIRRPGASEILDRISQASTRAPQSPGNRVELVRQLREANESSRREIAAVQELSRREVERMSSQVKSLRGEVERLSVSHDSPRGGVAQAETKPHLLTPQAKLQWRRCAELPVVMNSPQVVVVGDRVYFGAGGTERYDDDFIVFQYIPERNEWTTLPPHTVSLFGMGQFQGDLITVGGYGIHTGITGKVYRFNKQSQKWEEFLKQIPTARFGLSLITTQSAIIACGGLTGEANGKRIYCSTVEVYTPSTSQWSTTDPLPMACGYIMSSVTIADTCYLLGGADNQNEFIRTVLYAPISSLVQKARSQQAASSSHTDSVWKTLPDTPLSLSPAASLDGCLLAVGGRNDDRETLSEVYVFIPLTNSWVRVSSGDLPEPRKECTAIQLPNNKLMVIGGWDSGGKRTNTVFMGSTTI